jgi:hypothetical protein
VSDHPGLIHFCRTEWPADRSPAAAAAMLVEQWWTVVAVVAAWWRFGLVRRADGGAGTMPAGRAPRQRAGAPGEGWPGCGLALHTRPLPLPPHHSPPLYMYRICLQYSTVYILYVLHMYCIHTTSLEEKRRIPAWVILYMTHASASHWLCGLRCALPASRQIGFSFLFCFPKAIRIFR